MARDAHDHRSSESSWLAQWFEAHARSITERLRRKAKRKDDAEDALQQTMLSILELADHRRASVKNESAYIYAAAVRKLAAMRAANARPYETTQFRQTTPPELSRDELLDRLHFERVLTDQLKRLPPLHQKVFVLKCLGKTTEEIAKECDLKPYKVDRILFDARTTLQPTFKVVKATDIWERSVTMIRVWGNQRSGKIFFGMTLDVFSKIVSPSGEARAEIALLEKRLSEAVERRKEADRVTRRAVLRVVNAVKGDPEEGEDSELLASMGYLPHTARSSIVSMARKKAAQAARASESGEEDEKA